MKTMQQVEGIEFDISEDRPEFTILDIIDDQMTVFKWAGRGFEITIGATELIVDKNELVDKTEAERAITRITKRIHDALLRRYPAEWYSFKYVDFSLNTYTNLMPHITAKIFDREEGLLFLIRMRAHVKPLVPL